MATGFQDPYETGELVLRDGHVENPNRSGSSGLGRRNYAPDNRKIPPEPVLYDPFRDTDAEADPPSTIAADGFNFDAEQATFIDGAGQVMPGSIIVQFTPPKWWGPASAYDVYAADTADFDADLFIRIGRISASAVGQGDSYVVTSHHLQRGRTYDIALVPLNADGAGMDPVDAPRGTVALTSVGDVPPDVVGFDAQPECCEILATWTPVTDDRNDVAYYEIRQGAAFAGGALVGRVWGWGAAAVVIPLALVPNPLSAPDDEFHIKAITMLGGESATEGSDTLTAIEIAALNARCCSIGRELTPAGGLDFLVVTSIMPSVVQPVFNVGHGAPAAGPGPGIPFYVDPATITPSGSLWNYTVRFGDTTLGGEVFPLTELT